MFIITEADVDPIRVIFSQEGELSAALELRRRFGESGGAFHSPTAPETPATEPGS
jgi:hypothetical protein